MDSLKVTVRQVMTGYAGKGLNGVAYLTQNEDGNIFAITEFAREQGQRTSDISLLVEILGDLIVIDRDQNDKILLDALLQAGIPREQIILAYAGEPVPEPEAV